MSSSLKQLPKPSELFEQLCDMVALTCKRVYRDEPVTPEELDILAERIARYLWELNPASIKPKEQP